MLVMVSHLVVLFWSAPELVSQAVLAPAPVQGAPAVARFLAGLPGINLGVLGVGIFFLISGFVIPLSLQSRSAGQFAWARLLRIFPTYWVALAIQIAVLAAVASFWEREQSLTWTRVLANAALAFNLFHVSSIDTVNWTLVVELQFYALAALGAVWLRAGRVWPLALFWLAACVGNLVFGRLIAEHLSGGWPGRMTTMGGYLEYLAFMTIGTLFSFHLRGFLSTRRLVLAALAGFGLFALGWYFGPWAEGAMSIVVSDAVALAVFAAAYAWRAGFRRVPLFDALAATSYPLYLVHAVLGYVTLRQAMGSWAWSYPAALALALAVIVVTAVVLHISVESWSIRAGRRNRVPLSAQAIIKA
jgi:peptidoglycan/LPS O-acetylase OafA/YrhL